MRAGDFKKLRFQKHVQKTAAVLDSFAELLAQSGVDHRQAEDGLLFTPE